MRKAVCETFRLLKTHGAGSPAVLHRSHSAVNLYYNVETGFMHIFIEAAETNSAKCEKRERHACVSESDR